MLSCYWNILRIKHIMQGQGVRRLELWTICSIFCKSKALHSLYFLDICFKGGVKRGDMFRENGMKEVRRKQCLEDTLRFPDLKRNRRHFFLLGLRNEKGIEDSSYKPMKYKQNQCRENRQLFNGRQGPKWEGAEILKYRYGSNFNSC